jgi:hypothetical protein
VKLTEPNGLKSYFFKVCIFLYGTMIYVSCKEAKIMPAIASPKVMHISNICSQNVSDKIIINPFNDAMTS